MPQNMGVDSLKANLTNPARVYLWDVIIPAPIGTGDTTTYQVRAQTSQVPQVSDAPIHIDYKQTAGVQVSGKKEYEHTWACTFLEGEDHKVYDALYSWTQTIVHDVTGVGVGDPLYKTDVYLNLVTVAGSNYMSVHLKGAWIQTIGTFEVSYATNDVIKYTVTFQFDSIEIETH